MVQLSLFDNDDVLANCDYVTTNDIVSVGENSFCWLKENSRKINLKAKPVFDYFYSVNKLEPCDCPQYYCSPYWGEATNNFKWRYMIVKNENSFYLVFLRIVGVMTSQQYFSLSYLVLSSRGKNDDNVEFVTDTLKKLPAIKSVENIYDGDFSSCENVNFYCDKDSLFLNKNRRNKLSRANKLLTRGLCVRLIKENDIKEFERSVDALYDIFQEKRFKFNVRSAKNMLKIALSQPRCYVFAFYMNNVLVGVQMVCNDFVNSCSIHFAKDVSSLSVDDISKYTGTSLELSQKLRNFLGTFEEEYIKDKVIKNMGYDALFVDGFHKKSPSSMINHKTGYYNKCVYYKIEKI